MPVRWVIPRDKRDSPPMNHPSEIPLAEMPEQHQGAPELGSGVDSAERLPFKSNPGHSPRIRNDEEKTETDSAKNESIFNLRRFRGSNTGILIGPGYPLHLCSDEEETAEGSYTNESIFNLNRARGNNLGALIEDVHSSMLDSFESDKKPEGPTQQDKWDMLRSRGVGESSGQSENLFGLGLHGVESKVSTNCHSCFNNPGKQNIPANVHVKDSSSPEQPPLVTVQSQEETEESLSGLIDDLIAEEGGNDDVPDSLVPVTAKENPYPAILMETDHRFGLTDDQVAERRKEYGRNSLTQDKENNLVKFLLFFVGPIQFVMEVCNPWRCLAVQNQHVLTYACFVL